MPESPITIPGIDRSVLDFLHFFCHQPPPFVVARGRWQARGVQCEKSPKFCEHYRQWVKGQKRSMRQVHRAGEKLFIDYCGPTVPIVDASSGELRQAQVFVAVLGASSYTYAEATWTQELPQWIASHQRAFEFFGGAVELLVPDNLRSAVTKACRCDPKPNATYQELARHYGCAILPARPYKPKDKSHASYCTPSGWWGVGLA